MRPVNQLPLSLNEMKRSPLASSRNPDSPPKAGNREVKASPLRYSSDPKRTRVRSLRSNGAIGRALTSIETGAATENSSGGSGFGGGSVADCARASSGIAMVESPIVPDIRKRRRVRSVVIPECAIWRRPGIHSPCRGYGFRARSFHSRPGMTIPCLYECKRRRRPDVAGAAPWVSLNSSASFSVMAPPSSSASTMVTARR